MKKIFILTGEPSGDKLATQVIKELKKSKSDIEFLSVGGEHLKSIGITAQPIRAKAKVKIGDNAKINLFEFSGKIVSLVNSLIPSAKGCKRPKGPTTFGPFLS